MPTQTDAALAPRRQARQARSMVTVEAIFDATIQVLLRDGSGRLTTTRVAERAGVSVGTLYQYFPNKQALLYAVLQRHLGRVVREVESAARACHHEPLATIVASVVDAFVRAKTACIDEARALYAVASDLDAADLVKTTGERGVIALAAVLRTATDAAFRDPDMNAYIFAAAMVGPTRTMVEGGAPARMLRRLRGHLVSLCLGYLQLEASAFRQQTLAAAREVMNGQEG